MSPLLTVAVIVAAVIAGAVAFLLIVGRKYERDARSLVDRFYDEEWQPDARVLDLWAQERRGARR